MGRVWHAARVEERPRTAGWVVPVAHLGAHRSWIALYSFHRHFLMPVSCQAWLAVDNM